LSGYHPVPFSSYSTDFLQCPFPYLFTHSFSWLFPLPFPWLLAHHICR
jgi:hypothetical protein